MEQSDFDDFAAHAVDFHPIAVANSVLPHQHEPAEKSDDKILHRNRKPRAGEGQNRRHLAGHAENNHQNQNGAHRPSDNVRDRAQGQELLLIWFHTREHSFQQVRRNEDCQADEQHQGNGNEQAMHQVAAARGDQRAPLPVHS